MCRIYDMYRKKYLSSVGGLHVTGKIYSVALPAKAACNGEKKERILRHFKGASQH